MRLRNKSLAAFTLLESLLALAITAFLLLSFSGTVSGVFQQVEESLFFLSFENLYRDSQKLANTKQEKISLSISESKISNGRTSLEVPKGIKPRVNYRITFDQGGGNSSLEKLVFVSSDQEVAYQLYLGSGNYKKTKTKSLYTP